MKRDVNQLLLGLLLMACFSMAVLVFYYNLTFDQLNDKYEIAREDVDNKSSLLSRTINELEEKQALLDKREATIDEYLKELNLSKSRESSLGDHFTDIKTQRDQLDVNLNQTINERDQWISSYNDMRDERDECTVDLSTRTRDLNAMKTMSSTLYGKSVNMHGRIQDFYATIDNMGDTVDDIDSYVNAINNQSIRSSLQSWVSELETQEGNFKGDADYLKQNMDEMTSSLEAMKR